MIVSAGHLDGLLNYSFTADEFEVLSVQTYTASGDGSLLSLSVTSNGTKFLSISSPQFMISYTISAISNSLNQISVDQYGSYQGGQPALFQTITLDVVGYAANSILVSFGSGATLVSALQNGLAVGDTTATISTSQLSAGTPIVFTSGGTFQGGAACFALGTRIRTERGEVAVEDLRDGDMIPCELSGRVRRVVWVGRRTIDVARHPRPWDVAPVLVRADAFAPGRPARDLVLSPDHAVRVGDALVPIRYLLNGATIAQHPSGGITYLHVELDAHDVLFAEGLPCESYLDTGNRGAFANAEGPVQLAPDFSRAVWAARGCLPLRLEGARVLAEKRRLSRRARALGWRRTRRPALAVTADGRPLASARHGQDWQVALPTGTGEVRLCSRAAVPAELSAAAADGRRLGVAIAELRLDGVIPVEAQFVGGWHDPEAGFRWTDGAARLRTGDARMLTFQIVMAETYWQGMAARPSRRRAA